MQFRDENGRIVEVPNSVVAAGLFCFAAGVAGIGYLIYRSHQADLAAEAAMQAYVEQNPAPGQIAFSSGSMIYVVDADITEGHKSSADQIQARGHVTELAWLDHDSLLYAAPSGPEALSPSVYQIDLDTGLESLLFDPYTDLGDLDIAAIETSYAEAEVAADEKVEQELQEARDEGRRAGYIRITAGAPTSAVSIESLGSSNGVPHARIRINEVDQSGTWPSYDQVSLEWFALQNGIQQVTVMPELDLRNLTWDAYEIVESSWGDSMHAQGRRYYRFPDHSQNYDWFVPED